MRTLKRIAVLTKDATLYEDSIQLNYKRRGFSALFSGPPKTVCPPIEKLKKGTKIRLTFQNERVMSVELA